jgi:tetratricopeptide (TPR) repeat protein
MRQRLFFPLLLLTLAFAGCSSDPNQRSAKLIERGQQYYDKREFNRALILFRSAVQVAPRNAEAYYRTGLAYLAKNQLQNGADQLLKARALDPKHVGVRTRLAELMALSSSEEQQKQAKKMAQDVLTTNPNDASALNALAIAELQLGSPQDAQRDLEKAVKSAPTDLRSSVNLASLRVLQKDSSGGVEILKQAVARMPDSAPAALELGQAYLADQKLKEAEEQYRRALSLDKDYAPAMIALAAIEIRTNRTGEAEVQYKKLSQRSEREFRPLLGLYYWQMGKQEPAIAEFKRLYDLDTEDRENRTRLISAYLVTNKVDMADHLLDAALKHNPKDSDALLQRSQILLDRGRYDEASTALQQLLGDRSDSAKGHYLMAHVHSHKGDKTLEQQDLREVLKLSPTALPARIELAKSLLETTAPSAALDVLNSAPAEQKGTAALITARNWALMADGRWDELNASVTQMLKKDRSPELVLQDALIKIRQKHLDEARVEIREVLDKNPSDTRAIDILGSTYLAENHAQEAVKAVQQYTDKSPKNAQLRMLVGDYYARAGQNAEARKEYEESVRLAPTSDRAQLALATTEVRLKDFDRARKDLDEVIHKNPRNVVAHALLGDMAAAKGQTSVAIDDYRKVLETDPNNVQSLNNLAYLLSEKQDSIDQALSYAQKASEIAPNNGTVEDTVGWLMYRKGIYTTALHRFESAVNHDPKAGHRFHLAMALYQTGDKEKSKKVFEETYKAAPSAPEALPARELIYGKGR